MAYNGRYHVKMALDDRTERHATAIRAICYMHEIGASAHEVFDDNDRIAVHLVIYENGEPIGCTRIRWFAGFAKVERTAFLPKHRHPGAIKALGAFTFDYCARKGFRKVVIHARGRFVPLWTKLFGFRVAEGRSMRLLREKTELVELVLDLPEADDPITVDSPMEMQIRPEGSWDTPTFYAATPVI